VSEAARPVRVGLLGAGRIGSFHAELLAREVEGAALAAVGDVDAEAAGALAQRLHVPALGPPQLLAADVLDAVAICTSTDTHIELIEAAAAEGKAIFCEKPLSLELALVDRALAAVERAGVLLMVGFNRRFDPGHASVRDAVAAGALGEVQLVRISSRDPAPPPLAYVRVSGGLFLDMTIHDLDMARFVTQSEIVEVYAQGGVRISPELEQLGDVDTAIVTLLHESGALTAIDNSRRAAYGFDQRVEAFGSAGMAASESTPAHGGVLRTAEGSRLAPLPGFFRDRYRESYVREWEAFAAAVRAGGPSPVSGADGRAPLAAGLAAWRSLREHRPVPVADIG
jgi:myo-inositol 2-dehydrogenase/D-chiro-inositol 1-dehydrogenase